MNPKPRDRQDLSRQVENAPAWIVFRSLFRLGCPWTRLPLVKVNFVDTHFITEFDLLTDVPT